jgi:hypothetical protein
VDTTSLADDAAAQHGTRFAPPQKRALRLPNFDIVQHAMLTHA